MSSLPPVALPLSQSPPRLLSKSLRCLAALRSQCAPFSKPTRSQTADSTFSLTPSSLQRAPQLPISYLPTAFSSAPCKHQRASAPAKPSRRSMRTGCRKSVSSPSACGHLSCRSSPLMPCLPSASPPSTPYLQYAKRPVPTSMKSPMRLERTRGLAPNS